MYPSPDAFYAAGVISLARQHPEEALAYFNQAKGIKLYAEDIVWYSALAHQQIALRHPEHRPQAVMALKEVLETSQPEMRYRWAKKLSRAL